MCTIFIEPWYKCLMCMYEYCHWFFVQKFYSSMKLVSLRLWPNKNPRAICQRFFYEYQDRNLWEIFDRYIFFKIKWCTLSELSAKWTPEIAGRHSCNGLQEIKFAKTKHKCFNSSIIMNMRYINNKKSNLR